MLKNRVVVSPIKIIGQGDRIILTGTRRFIQNHDPVGVRIWQRPKKNCVDDAEDRGVRADSERERHDRHRREARIFAQLPQCESKIIHNEAPPRDRRV